MFYKMDLDFEAYLGILFDFKSILTLWDSSYICKYMLTFNSVCLNIYTKSPENA